MKLHFPIVIVDDDEAVRGSLETLLVAHGNTVRTYGSGASFLGREFGDELFSVLLDIRMEGMNGFTVQRSIERFARPIPVIFMTAHQIEEARLRQNTGSEPIMTLIKPFTPEQLFTALNKADGLLRIS